MTIKETDLHDPMCSPAEDEFCHCELVAKVRADERERIATAIEAQHVPADEFCCFSDQVHGRLILDARIARAGRGQG